MSFSLNDKHVRAEKVSPGRAYNIRGILYDFALRGGGRAQRQVHTQCFCSARAAVPYALAAQALNMDLQSTYGQTLDSVCKDGTSQAHPHWAKDELESSAVCFLLRCMKAVLYQKFAW